MKMPDQLYLFFKKGNSLIKMNRLILLVLVLLASLNIFAREITNKDIEQIHKDINNMYTAFETGDASLLLASAHSSIYKITGGKSNYESLVVSSVEEIMEQGIIFHEAKLGKPTKLYLSGEEEICFVPRVSIMEYKGQKMKSTGFLIAIRSKGSNDWKYLDGSGLRRDQGLLWKLLPELSKDVELPANFLEKL